MRIIAFAAIVCSGIVVSGYAAEKGVDITTFSAKGITGVNIRTAAGDVYVDTQKRADIQVEQLPDNRTACDVTMEAVDGVLVLKAIEKDGVLGNIKTGFRVHLPSALPVLADTISGDIKAGDLTSPVKAKTVSGDVKLAGITGAIDVETTSGDIRLVKGQGPVRMETVSGDIHAAFAKSAKIAVEARTTSGKVKNEFAGGTGVAVSARTISGDITIIKK
ncbi:MAG: DUF4097 family beta strand repeat-containing protein [Spirochaetota bacterium]|nr:DUF4097 family beta strand repeat-containing protein [Elusimicrobiales bacterium]